MKHYSKITAGRGRTHELLSNGKITVLGACWAGAVRITLTPDGRKTRMMIERIPWRKRGIRQVLFDGHVGKAN